MTQVDLVARSRDLPAAWRSVVLAEAGNARLKVSRMDATASAAEAHERSEGLLLLDGQLQLNVGGAPLTLHAGELYIVPAGVPHGVEAGSTGTLVIFELPPAGHDDMGGPGDA